VRVTQLGLDDTKTVSNLRYMLEQLVPTRARPWLTCVGPKCEGNGVQPGGEHGWHTFPKRKAQSIPSIRAVELAVLTFSQGKNQTLLTQSSSD